MELNVPSVVLGFVFKEYVMWTFHPANKTEKAHVKFNGEKMCDLHEEVSYSQGIAIVSALNKEKIND